MDFKNIFNFRSVITFSKIKNTKNDIIFRSSNLDSADSNEVEKLLKQYKITTIIDLRSKNEIKNSKDLKLFFPVAIFQDDPLSALSSNQEKEDKSPNKEVVQSGVKTYDEATNKQYVRRTYRVDLVNKQYKNKVIWKNLKFKDVLYLLYYYIMFKPQKGHAYIASKYIAPKGLSGLYIDLVKYSGIEIANVFKRIEKVCDQPFLVHCAHGKDRTGIIIALLLSLLKVNRNIIIEDYLTSLRLLKDVNKEIEKEMIKSGLNQEFALVTEKAITDTLNYIDEAYAGVDKYLNFYGFSYDLQESLRSKLLIQNS
ncbi:hypothetical protein K502DRAFT_344957 [Neoconidiobolus thromboides FSU 785]|nr:hypothetical protein K502DRAFT_344957 [Neoconidiobolus thromboides FSU 785]